jgi:hypothetical protein
MSSDPENLDKGTQSLKRKVTIVISNSESHNVDPLPSSLAADHFPIAPAPTAVNLKQGSFKDFKWKRIN